MSATILDARGSRGSNGDFAELKRLVKQRGLFAPQPAYYAFKIPLTLGLLVLPVASILVVRSFWLQLLTAVFLAFAFTQLALLGHDIGHHQVFRSRRWILVSTLSLDLLVGLSLTWWTDRHNRHHIHPNEFDVDPDIETPLFSFRTDGVDRSRARRFVIRHQAYLFVVSLLIVAVAFQVWSVNFLIRRGGRQSIAEGSMVALHYVAYFGLVFSRLSLAEGLMFIVINQMAFGLFTGSTVASNHKGMPTVDKDTDMDYLHRQVITTRNVRAHPVTDFWYGTLNYQIEHHLFPSIPRNRLTELQENVRAFCKAHAIPYHETGVVQSYREILQALNEVSASLSPNAKSASTSAEQ